MFFCTAGETSGSGRRPHKGVSQGKLVPGEKQRLKRAKVDAKRAARAAAKGFDAAAIILQLEAFVLAEGDMKVGFWHRCSLFSYRRTCLGVRIRILPLLEELILR